MIKLDLDLKLTPNLLRLFLETRIALLNYLGYTVKEIKVRPSVKGYHIWISINEEITDYENAILQFLLGDDQRRAKLNLMRENWGAFKPFNKLYSKRLKYRASPPLFGK